MKQLWEWWESLSVLNQVEIFVTLWAMVMVLFLKITKPRKDGD